MIGLHLPATLPLLLAVNNRPKGAVVLCSAARCRRRTAVRLGGDGICVTTRGTAPLRNVSSITHKISSGRAGVMKVKFWGLVNERIPSGLSVSRCHLGAIQNTCPVIWAATIIANPTRDRPLHSWTRACCRATPSNTVTFGDDRCDERGKAGCIVWCKVWCDREEVILQIRLFTFCSSRLCQ